MTFENIFFGKVVLLGVKEFHGLHDDLKTIWKKVNPWPLFKLSLLVPSPCGVPEMESIRKENEKFFQPIKMLGAGLGHIDYGG